MGGGPLVDDVRWEGEGGRAGDPVGVALEEGGVGRHGGEGERKGRVWGRNIRSPAAGIASPLGAARLHLGRGVGISADYGSWRESNGCTEEEADEAAELIERKGPLRRSYSSLTLAVAR